MIHYDPSLPLPTLTLPTPRPTSVPKPAKSPSESSTQPVFASTIHLDDPDSASDKAPAAPGGVISFSEDEEEETKESMTSLRREWSEKRQEIDAKRARVAADDASGASEESETEGEVDLQAETREYQRILAGVLGKPTLPTEEESVPVAAVAQNGAMGDLFEESAAQSFSLFNFLPEKEDEIAPVAQDGATVLEQVAPTAWYNERSGGAKSTVFVAWSQDVVGERGFVGGDSAGFQQFLLPHGERWREM